MTQIVQADQYTPNPKWNRPRRVELIEAMLDSLAIPEARMYLGGERFTFTFREKFVVVGIHQWNLMVQVYISVGESEEGWRVDRYRRKSTSKTLPAKASEEAIRDAAESLVIDI